MTLTERSVADFLAAIRAPAPTPGGGSAAALAGALGASLLAMVAAMPRNRARSEEDVDRLQAAGARCANLSERLTALVNKDSEAYDLVVAAYRLPNASDNEKAERTIRVQTALAAAIDAPLDVARQAGATIEAAAVVARFGNAAAASDVGVALELLRASAAGARLNVEINLPSLRDVALADRLRREVKALDAECITGVAAARVQLTAGSREA